MLLVHFVTLSIPLGGVTVTIATGSKSPEPHLSHEDLGPLDEHRGAGDVEPLLQTLQAQLLHLLIAALHLHRMEGQGGDLLHVLGADHRVHHNIYG